jgi:hypothetical protein
MYLPENDAQMHDILADLRLYAQLNGMARLAEELDDAILLLAAEGQRAGRRIPAPPCAGGDGR